MDLSIVLSTQPTSFNALAFQGELEQNIARIAHLGYDGVELAVREPALLDVAELETLVAQWGLAVPAIGTGQIFFEEGLSLTSPETTIRRKALDRLRSHMRLADRLNAIVIIGLARGKQEPGVNDEQVMHWLEAGLIECASENPEVRWAIEPVNRYETSLVNTVASGLSLLDSLGLENVGLLLDTFHMNIEEPSMMESIKAAGDRLFHVHIADSNRWYPGAGHINFDEIVETLHQAGYQGFLSAEILPLPDPDTVAEKTIAYMRRFTD